MKLVLFLSAVMTLFAADMPIQPHPANPHYFLFRGKPTVLITSGEHYGAVLNGAFDYRKYLDTLAANNLNLTRTFTGMYREVPGESFEISGNTLAPRDADFIHPFAGKDLTKWNPAYFERWRDFVRYAGTKGIIVEVTLFTSYYNENHWKISPTYSPDVKSDEVLALKHPAQTEIQERFVRKLVAELKDFDNIYYEVCNEPYFHGITEAWQRRIAAVVAEADGKRHMISRNIANGAAEIKDPDPNISLFNFHYARPPRAVAMNWNLNKPIGLNETGFDGALDATYRIQAWDFLLAGGALYNNLDYSFTVGHEDGSYVYPATQPGGGTANLRKQLRLLRQFFDALPLLEMKPDEKLLAGNERSEIVSSRALSNGKSTWAIYAHTGKAFPGYKPGYGVWSRKLTTRLIVDLPAGDYEVQWWLPLESAPRNAETWKHLGGSGVLTTPEYAEDVAAIIRKRS
ncbi:MAG: cellulase family glycosylhydrolase [Acidobacteria bacterium]|nr:cellulase family glycosylhydrolase [Acidobacteriota bacterium]